MEVSRRVSQEIIKFNKEQLFHMLNSLRRYETQFLKSSLICAITRTAIRKPKNEKVFTVRGAKLIPNRPLFTGFLIHSMQHGSDKKEEELLAPDNFAMVESGVYRSAFPRSKNMSFLKALGLKSVISLVPEEYPEIMVNFYEENDIKLISHALDGNKWPFKQIDEEKLRNCLLDILNPKNHPLLIHCNKGKHRTGTVIGSLRKLRRWAYSAIFQEYILYAAPKVRLEDQMLIEAFEMNLTEPDPS